VASATWHSQSNCGGGTVHFTASAPSATSTNGSVAVTAVQPANVVYSGATAQTLVVSSAGSGVKQSTISFQVVDSAAPPAGMPNQSVTISLNSQAVSAGVKFNVSGTLTAANQVISTDNSGMASVTIQSSTFPTPVSVTATLTATPAMTASSSGIVVTAGAPSQNNTSLSASTLNLNGFGKDGVSTNLTLRTSDREGNPVPAGTVVTFITNTGTIIPGSCSTDSSSSCSVVYTTSGTRRADGVVAILAYLAGEESFDDANGNNVWDTGETVYNMGQPYRDDNHNNQFDGTDQPVGTTNLSATSACTPAGLAYLSIAGTCDGTWTPAILVRQPIRLYLSGDIARITTAMITAGLLYRVTITDAATFSSVAPAYAGPMAFGTSVSAVASSTAGTCQVVGAVAPSTVLNASAPTTHDINLNNLGCGGGGAANITTITITVNSTNNIQTTATIVIP